MGEAPLLLCIGVANGCGEVDADAAAAAAAIADAEGSLPPLRGLVA